MEENGITRTGDLTLHSFEALPIEEACLIIDEIYLDEFETELSTMAKGGNPHTVGYSSWARVKKLHGETAEIFYILDNLRRFHAVNVWLPKTEFIKCIECYNRGVKPRIFVSSRWLRGILKQHFSVYALIDAIGVKKAIQENRLSNEVLLSLRDRVDEIAEKYPHMCFISFADSLLIKRNWQTSFFVEKQKSTYEPETIFAIIQEVQSAYRDTLGLSVYAIVTQGSNGYDQEAPLHISNSQNHVCLNSLGVPFSELMNIENSVRRSIKSQDGHSKSELYLDRKFFSSLNFTVNGRENANKGAYPYDEKLTSAESEYYLSSCEVILENLE